LIETTLTIPTADFLKRSRPAVKVFKNLGSVAPGITLVMIEDLGAKARFAEMILELKCERQMMLILKDVNLLAARRSVAKVVADSAK